MTPEQYEQLKIKLDNIQELLDEVMLDVDKIEVEKCEQVLLIKAALRRMINTI